MRNRITRNIEHGKQNKSIIYRKKPTKSEMEEGTPVYAISGGRLTEYIKIDNKIYEKEYSSRNDAPSNVKNYDSDPFKLNLSMGDIGYQVFDSGLILQWGNITVAASAVTVWWPKAFPRKVFSICANYGVGSSTGGAAKSVGIMEATLVNTNYATFSTDSSMNNMYWMAIGF